MALNTTNRHKNGEQFDINYVYGYAKSINLTCISTKYNNCYSNLKWKCSNNHIFILPLVNIKHKIRKGVKFLCN